MDEAQNEKMSIRTDLALEAREMAGDINTELEGIKVTVNNISDINMEITKVEVLNDEGSKKINKPPGNYITIECDNIKRSGIDNKKDIVEAIANELVNIIDCRQKTILVVGLGNNSVTPDALGPKVVRQLLVTRHLFQEFDGIEDDILEKVSAIAPGVMGQTGMETVEIIKGVVNIIKPDFVIAIDALASRRISRLNTTIQVADTGVQPGSGVGNKRKGLNEETLGVPVIAIGVPTVVDAATIVNDTMEEIIKQTEKHIEGESPLMSGLSSMGDHEKYSLIKEVLYPYVGDMFVTPKEIDEVIERISDIVAIALNLTLHPRMEYDEVRSWLS